MSRRHLTHRARALAMRFRHSFRRSLEDSSLPLSLDMAPDSTTLVVAFGGMRGQLGMPPFEFFKVTGAIPVKRMFVRDLHQVWYHRGIPGYGDTLAEAAGSLRALADEHGVERVVVAGNSAGGYAALAFASLLGAHTALAFAPQTVLLPDQLEAMDDHRWDVELGDLIAHGGIDQRFADLRDTLAAADPGPRYEVYFDERLLVDRLHAERIDGVDGVTLHRLSGGAHSVALQMRQSGELERVLREALLAG
jgi:pimeloyl-ACP methyl ester carboxylesterase